MDAQRVTGFGNSGEVNASDSVEKKPYLQAKQSVTDKVAAPRLSTLLHGLYI